MSPDLLKKLVEDLSEFQGKVKLLRVCGNGDPLMNRSLLSMLDHVKSKEAVERVELLTNGGLLTPELTTNLPKFLDRIVFSIEGLCTEDYQRVCSVKLDFDKLLKNIDALYGSKGKCVVHVKIHHEAVTKEDEKKRFMSMFENRCDEIFIEKLVPMWPQLNTKFTSNEFRWGGGSVTKRRVCAQIFKGVQVQADGEVVPCCVDWKRVNVLGNINNEALSDIWNGPMLKRLQIEHLSGRKFNLQPCRDCTMNDYCEVDNIDLNALECLTRLNSKELHPRADRISAIQSNS